uniref:Uncharacterized protein n=1 Tax=Panagrolaimus sp. PS1159 TaxID=55785 RepID=A0AC35G9B2_9BILA
MFFTSTSSLSFLLCFAFLVSDSIVFGKLDVFSHNALKQLILSDSNACDNVEKDVESQCPASSFGDSCSDKQKHVNCIIGVVKTDCGEDGVKKACDEIMSFLNLMGNDCKTKCPK